MASASEARDITALLHRFRDGDDVAGSDLVNAVHNELKLMASRYMRRERHGHTLQTTALVNEAYLKLVKAASTDWKDRAHFFGVAAQVMRHILVDHARRSVAGKRGGEIEMLPLDEGLVFSQTRSSDLVRLDDALGRLATLDERASRVIELRFFGGLSIEETAEVLAVSVRTVKRDWMFGRSWLRAELKAGGANEAAMV